MTGLLLIQAFTGWCWHCPHDQARKNGCGSHALTATDSCDHDCHHDADDQCSDGPCKCQLECQGFCTYLPTDKAHVDSPLLVVPFEFAALQLSSSSAQLVGLYWERSRDPVLHEPPLRLHLLHQIMLI